MDNFERFQTFVVQNSALKNGPIDTPIVGSTSFAYENAESAEDIFSGRLKRDIYARMGNPTNSKLEILINGIDEGDGALVTSSGMGAIAMVTTSFLEAGDEVVCVGGLFGGSYAFFSQTIKRFGIEAKFFKTADEIEITDKTKMLFCESVSNPNMKIVDFEKIASIANKNRLLFVVDNTLTPLLFKPFKWGADIVVYSTTKIISGHSQALGGAIVYKEPIKKLLDRFSFFKNFYESLGKDAIKGILKKRSLRDFGMSMSANSAYLTILGLQTLSLRLQRSCENALDIVRDLKEDIEVIHPLFSQPELLDKYFPCSCGQMFSLELGSKDRAFRFLDNFKSAFITANLGDARTLAIHPKSTIYKDFSEEECRFLGVTDGLVRISIGLENREYLINDLKKAIRR